MTDDFWNLLYRFAESLCCALIGVFLIVMSGLNVTFDYTGPASHVIILVSLFGGFLFLGLGIFLFIDCGRKGTLSLNK
jgi:hypothetical protein